MRSFPVPQIMRKQCSSASQKALVTRVLFILTRCSRLIVTGKPVSLLEQCQSASVNDLPSPTVDKASNGRSLRKSADLTSMGERYVRQMLSLKVSLDIVTHSSRLELKVFLLHEVKRLIAHKDKIATVKGMRQSVGAKFTMI